MENERNEQSYQKRGGQDSQSGENQSLPKDRADFLPVRIESSGEEDKNEGDHPQGLSDPGIIEIRCPRARQTRRASRSAGKSEEKGFPHVPMNRLATMLSNNRREAPMRMYSTGKFPQFAPWASVLSQKFVA